MKKQIIFFAITLFTFAGLNANNLNSLENENITEDFKCTASVTVEFDVEIGGQTVHVYVEASLEADDCIDAAKGAAELAKAMATDEIAGDK
ncbi:hypothetical protein [Aureivirga marina]|uniref:hypothetical protein n=1 Tax=Aureivirga marina TaxID=1182451 RepID=UPI0018C8E75D|nr:hypothetical protein [Aureivirga marina]